MGFGESTGDPALPVTLRFQPDVIVHGAPEPLLAAQVSFGRLHRNVPQQELNLLQLAAGGSAKPGAASTEIVRRELADVAAV